MTLFEYVNKNIDHIKLDTKCGIISCTFLNHWEIYCRFDYYRKAGNPVCIAVINAAKDFRVKESTVFKIKKQMECEVS